MGVSVRTINEILSPFNPVFDLKMLGIEEKTNSMKK